MKLLSVMLCVLTVIEQEHTKNMGDSYNGITVALQAIHESSILSSSTKYWVSGEVGESRQTVNLLLIAE